jgi:methyl-accepting chemotaxis protein
MSTEYGLTARFRQSYSAQVGMVVGFALITTLAFMLGFTLYLLAAPPDLVMDRAIGVMVALAIVFIVNLGVVGAVLGGNVATALNKLSSRAERIGEGEFGVSLETDRTDEIGELYDAIDEMRTDIQTQLSEIERAKDEVESTKQEATEFNEHLQSEAMKFSRVMGAAAEGDLDQRYDPPGRSDAMAEIATAFNEMIGALETARRERRKLMSEVETDVEAPISELSQSTRDVADQAASLNKIVTEQQSAMERTSGEVAELSATVEEVASTTTEVTHTSELAEERAKRGRESSSEALEAMEAIETAVADASSKMNRVEEGVEQVSEVTDLINDIAEQTRILALNASIEAARADGGSTSGDGFAVVADEVKSLAAESKESVNEIEALVEDVQAETVDAADGLRTAMRRVDAGTAAVEQTESDLDEIVSAVQETSHNFEEVSDTTDTQAETAEQIASSINDLVGELEAMADSIDEMALATQSQTEQVDAIASATEQLTSGGDATDQTPSPAQSGPQLAGDGGSESVRNEYDAG